mmetsp:Transcript_97662/g.304262  ORF Transcript_97662/g.304262 Transcript_97662/m.304262 type:complete len:324 (+) Transcript_97662:116-1087(+)
MGHGCSNFDAGGIRQRCHSANLRTDNSAEGLQSCEQGPQLRDAQPAHLATGEIDGVQHIKVQRDVGRHECAVTPGQTRANARHSPGDARGHNVLHRQGLKADLLVNQLDLLRRQVPAGGHVQGVPCVEEPLCCTPEHGCVGSKLLLSRSRPRGEVLVNVDHGKVSHHCVRGPQERHRDGLVATQCHNGPARSKQWQSGDLQLLEAARPAREEVLAVDDEEVRQRDAVGDGVRRNALCLPPQQLHARRLVARLQAEGHADDSDVERALAVPDRCVRECVKGPKQPRPLRLHDGRRRGRGRAMGLLDLGHALEVIGRATQHLAAW